MNLRRVLQRLLYSMNPVKPVLCDSKDLKRLIKDWMNNEGWKFFQFAAVLNLVGITTPVRLTNLHNRNIFECEDRYGQKYMVTLRFGDWIEDCSEIVVTKTPETRVYIVSNNITAKLDRRGIIGETKELWSYYGENSWRSLTFKDGTKLEISIDVPDKFEIELDEARKKSMQHYKEIENYLFSLPNVSSLEEVYETVMNILGYSDEELKKCKNISFQYTRGKEVIEKIELFNGIVQKK